MNAKERKTAGNQTTESLESQKALLKGTKVIF